ncbi:hypothetical protein SDC9_196181 [bioreactor metagenome]|uniref:Uncharacterized protein n=1 Tax=bioreactor metagenome TaxID=1076179 RepID=A0A645IB57_9ZZZZ
MSRLRSRNSSGVIGFGDQVNGGNLPALSGFARTVGVAFLHHPGGDHGVRETRPVRLRAAVVADRDVGGTAEGLARAALAQYPFVVALFPHIIDKVIIIPRILMFHGGAVERFDADPVR